jgi:hypothetical protein
MGSFFVSKGATTLEGSMNDAKVLRLFSIYHKATWGDLFNHCNLHDNIKPYVIRHKGYPLLSWLMVQQKQTWVKHTILETLYNK